MRLSVIMIVVTVAALGLVFTTGCEQQAAEVNTSEAAAVVAEAVVEAVPTVAAVAAVSLTQVEAADGVIRFDINVSSEAAFDGFQFKVISGGEGQAVELEPTIVPDTGLEGINLVAGPSGVLGFGMGTQADAGTHRVATFTVVNKDLTGICVSAVSLNTPFTNEAGQRIAKVITLDDTCISL
jgi:hypothetical protein